MNSHRIYLGRLPYGTRERDIDRFLKGFGRIREINLKNGFGFVTFDDPRDAEDAVADLNNRELLGEKILVEACRGSVRGYSGGPRQNRARDKYGAPTRTPWRVIVENLSTRVSWQQKIFSQLDLKDYVRQAGEVTYGDAHRPVKGEGVLEFACHADVRNVIRRLDGTSLNGKRIRLIDDSPKEKRSRSRSRSRSSSRSRRGRRSRSRSRSKSRSRSRSKSRSRSRSRSRSSRSKSKSRSRSRSGSAKDRSSPAKSDGKPEENGDREEEKT